MSLIAGAAIGAAAGLAAGVLPRRHFSKDPDRPPELYEYFVDSIWFEHCGLYDEKINMPMKGNHKADIVIVGGGLAGLCSAYQLIQIYPDRRIVLLEGACCGYGASGRNAGHALTGMHGLLDISKKEGLDVARRYWDATLWGFNNIKRLAEEEGIDCDLEETGKIGFATLPRHTKVLQNYKKFFDDMGLESEFWDKKKTQGYMKTDRFISAWRDPHGGHLNPAKLARGMKKLIEKMGVEVFERSKVLRIEPGKKVRIVSEFGEITAPQVVLATNAYGPKIGIFKNQTTCLTVGAMATEPLTDAQVESLGWAGRESCWDMRAITASYFKLTVDNRIAYCGNLVPVFYDFNPQASVYRPSVEVMKETLFEKMFPQLKGVEITHMWGGSFGITMDWFPNIGVMGNHKNIFYACAFNGEGVVMTQLAGKIIADMIAQKKGDFSFIKFINRKPPYMLHEPLRYPMLKGYLWGMDQFGSNPLM